MREGLYSLGYTMADLQIDARMDAQPPDHFPGLAAELAGLAPAVVVAGNTPAVLAIRQAAPNLPIVMVECGDPVRTGLVESLPRPGGNVTGLTSVSPPLSGKRLQLLKEAFPGLSRVALVRNPNDPDTGLDYAATEAAAGALGLSLQPIEVRSGADFDGALEAMRSAQTEAIVTFHDTLILGNRARILGFALTNRLPTMFDRRLAVEQGGLMSYGPEPAASWRRAASYVDKILKGARPADLPVEQPTKFDFVVSLKTAGTLGFTIPPSVLLQATEVIQ